MHTNKLSEEIKRVLHVRLLLVMSGWKKTQSPKSRMLHIQAFDVFW